MSNAKPTLNDADCRLLGLAWQCFKDEKPINSNIDFEKLSKLAGHTNVGSTRNRINAIIKKLREAGEGDSEANSAPPTPTTPKAKAAKPGKAGGGTAGNKRKKVDNPEDTIKEEHSDDDEAAQVASPPAKTKRGRKPAASTNTTATGDTDDAAEKSKGLSSRGRPKKIKTEENSHGTDGTNNVDGNANTSRARSKPSGFVAVNSKRGRAEGASGVALQEEDLGTIEEGGEQGTEDGEIVV